MVRLALSDTRQDVSLQPIFSRGKNVFKAWLGGLALLGQSGHLNRGISPAGWPFKKVNFS